MEAIHQTNDYFRFTSSHFFSPASSAHETLTHGPPPILHSSQRFSIPSAKLAFFLVNSLIRQMLRSPSFVHFAPRFSIPSGLQWNCFLCSCLTKISSKEFESCACQSLGNWIWPQTPLIKSEALARPLDLLLGRHHGRHPRRTNAEFQVLV